MTDDEYATPDTTSAWGVAEQIVVGAVALAPAVLYVDSTWSFELVVVVYLALLTFMTAQFGGEYLQEDA